MTVCVGLAMFASLCLLRVGKHTPRVVRALNLDTHLPQHVMSSETVRHHCCAVLLSWQLFCSHLDFLFISKATLSHSNTYSAGLKSEDRHDSQKQCTFLAALSLTLTLFIPRGCI